jgi:arylsulfatase A-like enzyme
MADQFRGDCLSIDGHPHLMTPVLDGLAQRGIRFRHAYTPCPACVPARRCLLTGRTPFGTGVTGMDTLAMQARIDSVTLPEIFRRAGYQTISVGRGMHQHPAHARYGFEVFQEDPFAEVHSSIHAQVPRQSRAGSFAIWPHTTGGISANGFRSRPWPHDERFHETNWSISKAIEFLDHRDFDVPFFLHVGFVAPHPPLIPPACYLDRYLRMDLAPPVLGDWADDHPRCAAGAGAHYDGPWDGLELTGAWSQACRAGYYGSINHIDDQISLLLARLAMNNEDTYVIFTSDHGEMLGDHHWFRKSLPFEGSARIPLLVSGPGLPAGVVNDDAVNLVDILPTCCDLAGLPIPEWAEGTSLAAMAQGQGKRREYIHGEYSGNDPRSHHVITDGRTKFIWFTRDGREYLFDLAADPQERHNLVAAPERKAEAEHWRQRLIHHLQGRPEGFTDGIRLVPGRPYPGVVPKGDTATLPGQQPGT